MADLRTTVTELTTGLGMLGYPDIAGALADRPAEMASVAPEQWRQLEAAFSGGALSKEFDHAYENGREFLQAVDGLRGRRPLLIEWKGAQSNPGDEALPVDLRIDHVYLISCKYLSKILHNASPARVFLQCFRKAPINRAASDWYATVASDEYQRLYELTLKTCGAFDMPASPSELTTPDRKSLKDRYPESWPDDVEEAYRDLSSRVASESAIRWMQAMPSKADQEAALWRLLRLGSAPYFVLGSTRNDSLRLRIATPWDWRQRYSFVRLECSARTGGQPMVAWKATAKDRHTGEVVDVEGHVEIRWSHGRFGGSPEAKVYLDSAHKDVPGYFELEASSPES